MTDRVTVYTAQVPFDTDVLRTNLYDMVSIAKLSEALIGTSTTLVGLECVPTAPTSLNVLVNPGQIYIQKPTDETPYGVIPADPALIVKQGLTQEDSQEFSTPAPVTPGDSIIYLIEVGFNEVDINVVNRPYFNSANPNIPIFNANSDTRQDQCVVQIVAGTPAPSPVAPTPDPGFVPAWLVTVAFGQTTVTGANIAIAPGAPFINGNVGDFLTESEGDARYSQPLQIQNSQFTFGIDTGSTNLIVVNVTPAIILPIAGTIIQTRIAATNTGPTTINVNGLGALQVFKYLNTGASSLTANDLTVNYIAQIMFDGANWILLNPITLGIGQASSVFETIANFTTFANRFSLLGGNPGSFTIPTTNTAFNIIVNFGNTDVTGSGGGTPTPVTVNYTTPFTTSSLCAIASQNGNFPNTATASPINNSQIQLRSIGTDSGVNDIFWISIGV